MAALAGQHAVVTGGGKGIGRAVAAALTAAGASVTVLGRTEATLRDAVSRGEAAGYAIADATDAKAMSDAVTAAADARGAVTIMIANAGGAESAPFAKTSPDLFRRMFELNTISAVNAAHAVLPGMMQRHSGRIVAIASIAGLHGAAYVSAYCAAKHATVGLVRSLAAEVAKSGVTVNAVCPGYTDTEMVSDSLKRIEATTGRSRDEALGSMLKSNAAGRLIKPAEVAAAVVFLCSPEAAAISGETLTIA